MSGAPARWYLLIHQIPPRPLYLRAKIRQRLARVGAVALKKSVYVLPRDDDRLENFQWIAEEAVAGGGEAHICEAGFVGERIDEQLVERFNAERATDFERLAGKIRRLLAQSRRPRGASPDEDGAMARIRKRFAEIADIDFFGAPNRKAVQALLGDLERRSSAKASDKPGRRRAAKDLVGRTWVTRKGLHIDRIASAWLVRRFVDPKARFRFIDPGKEKPRSGELRFDMVGGDFTHEGDGCTFETLLRRLGLEDPALSVIGEIVHDVDVKDAKFGRPEASGVEQLVLGIVLAHADDEDRLDRGSALFDDLYRSFDRHRSRLSMKSHSSKGGRR